MKSNRLHASSIALAVAAAFPLAVRAAGDETATIERLARTGDGDGRRAALAVLADLDRDPNRMPPI